MASRPRAVSQTIESLLIKTFEMDPNRFGTTLYFCCDGVDAHPIPTVHHHARSHDPIGGAMPTGGSFAELPFFLLILSGSRSEHLWHPSSPPPLTFLLLFYHI